MQIQSVRLNPSPIASARKQTATPVAADKTVRAAKDSPNLLEGLGNFFHGLIDGLFGKTTDDLPNEGGKEHPIHAYQPADGTPEEQSRAAAAHSRGTVLFVNGALQDLDMSNATAGFLSQKLGRDVELIHNATAVKKSEGGLLSPLMNVFHFLTGGFTDISQVTEDHFGRGHDPAVEEVKATLAERLGAGERVDVIGHSQGNTTIARATQELLEEHPELADKMGNLHVINMAGAARREDYAPGISYDHVELSNDFVPKTAGEAMDPALLPHRDDLYGLVVSPAAVFSGFALQLLQSQDPHDPVNILNDPYNFLAVMNQFA